MFIIHLDSVAFDGNAALAFQLHVIQGLILHIPHRNGIRKLQKPVGQGAFPVVNVCNYTEISDIFHVFLMISKKRGKYTPFIRMVILKSAFRLPIILPKERFYIFLHRILQVVAFKQSIIINDSGLKIS